MVPTSKKDAPTRREELLKQALEPLLDACIQNAESMMVTVWGCNVLLETVLEANQRADSVANAEKFRALPQRTIADLVARSLSSGDEADGDAAAAPMDVDGTSESGAATGRKSLVEDPYAQGMISKLLKRLSPDGSGFAALLYEALINADEGLEKTVSSDRGAFLLHSLLLAADSDVRTALTEQLQPHRESITDNAGLGYKKLLAALDGPDAAAAGADEDD